MANTKSSAAVTEFPGSFTRNRSVVLAAALIAMLLAAGIAWFAIGVMSKETTEVNLLPVWPIRAVTFAGGAGELKRVDADDLKRIAGAIQNLGGNMLRTDLGQVKAAVKQVEWVRDAEVRRRFPFTLEVHIEEHTPFARWHLAGEAEQSQLVNTYGEVFDGDIEAAPLPVFSGPKDSAREIMANHQAFATQLAAIEQLLLEVRLSARRAWQLKLANGTTLELGRNDAGERLARYVRAFPSIAALRIENSRIDLRYQTGFAIQAAKATSVKPPGAAANKLVQKAPVKS